MKGSALTTTKNDPDRLARLRAGDDDAWAEWFDDHGPLVWSYVARLTGTDSATVADMVQEVFLAVAKGLATFDETRGTLISWLLGIAHRRTALFWRQRKRQEQFFQSWSQQPSLSIFDESSEANIDQQELTEAVRAVVARLPDDAAAVLMGRYLDGHSTERLAADFGITEQAVRSRLSRARERFRELFETSHNELVPRP